VPIDDSYQGLSSSPFSVITPRNALKPWSQEHQVFCAFLSNVSLPEKALSQPLGYLGSDLAARSLRATQPWRHSTIRVRWASGNGLFVHFGLMCPVGKRRETAHNLEHGNHAVNEMSDCNKGIKALPCASNLPSIMFQLPCHAHARFHGRSTPQSSMINRKSLSLGPVRRSVHTLQAFV
jgi:hypothetical protein